jgi:hypothetical protein
MGATESLRSIKPAGFSGEMLVGPVFSMRSVRYLGVVQPVYLVSARFTGLRSQIRTGCDRDASNAILVQFARIG